MSGRGLRPPNKILLTVWDGGGDDTYSFANYATDLTVNLAPGGWSILSPVQLANLGSFRIATGNVANALLFGGNPPSLIENVIGGSGNDFLVGNAADNDLIGGAGSDFFDGAGGSNTVGYSGSSADYALVHNPDGGWTVSDLRAGSPDGSDTLARIQWLRFSDGLLALSSVTDPAPGVTNHAPEAHRDIYVTVKNTKLKVAAAGVLANDSDADGDLLSALRLSKSGKGAIALHDNGSFSFTPAKNFTGIFSFTYTANDGEAESGVTTVRIRVAQGAFRRQQRQWPWRARCERGPGPGLARCGRLRSRRPDRIRRSSRPWGFRPSLFVTPQAARRATGRPLVGCQSGENAIASRSGQPGAREMRSAGFLSAVAD